jgi:hypothetical protein
MRGRYRPCRGAVGLTEANLGRAQSRVLRAADRLGHRARDALVRQRSRPHRLGLAPGTARWFAQRDRQRGPCPEAALASSWTRTSPLHGARAAGLEGPAWGTREFRRRRAQCPAVAKPWQRAWRLRPRRAVWCSLGAATASAKPGGVVERQGSRVPVVTTRAKRKIFDRETPCLDFRGQRAVRPDFRPGPAALRPSFIP